MNAAADATVVAEHVLSIGADDTMSAARVDAGFEAGRETGIHQPLSPEVATPSVNCFWVKK